MSFIRKTADVLFPKNSKRRFFLKMIRKFIMSPGAYLANINMANIRKLFFYAGRLDPAELENRIDKKITEYSGGPDDSPVKGTDRTGYFEHVFNVKNLKSDIHVPHKKNNIPAGDTRVIAFYLPQYHPIPENDEWWGKGFTEWANVARGVPQYVGHYQPRIPGELGYYDLRVPEIRRRQAEMAKEYGINGFCFHFYWFGGKTLLEMPIKEFANDGKISLPFCLNWANENWTRRWDGMEKDILMEQKHSPEDDIEFIKHISVYLKHKNYIRVNGKPLLMVYRVALLPDAAQSAKRWRKWCMDNGIGEIYLALAHSFEHNDPEKIGFDAAVEFAPNTFPLKDITSTIEFANAGYKGRVYDYKSAVTWSEQYVKPPYKKFRGVCPGWENEARKPGRGTILENSNPELYKQWLKHSINYTRANFTGDERLVFINAWNEWSEGAYLEPDKRHGYANLQATADALIETKNG